MATTEEIRRRVEEADTARSARRADAAQRVGELAQRRAAIVEQLEEVERLLGEVLAEARDVMGIDELARFTDLSAADLTRWLETRTTARARRRRPSGTTRRTATAAQTPMPAEAGKAAEPVACRDETPARAMAG